MDQKVATGQVVTIAIVCHEANKAYSRSLGDWSHKAWSEAPAWQRESAIKGVQFCMDNPNAPASANHESWLAQKISEGWKYGAKKDEAKKEHPCVKPFNELPIEQQKKDHLFKAIVAALA